MTRHAYLTSLIGRQWAPTSSCWHLAVEVERELFGRTLPDVTLPESVSWRWMMDTISTHPEGANWREVTAPPIRGLLNAKDGALVPMARADSSAHIGVWLAPERLVIHCDQRFHVQAVSPAELRAAGWNRIRFFEPIT